MKLVKFEPKHAYRISLTARIYRKNLYVHKGLSKKMNLTNDSRLLFATNTENNDDALYVSVTDSKDTASFKVTQLKDGTQVSIGALINQLGIADKTTFKLDGEPFDYEGKIFYKLLKQPQ